MEVSVFPDILNTVAELYIETNLCAFQPHTQLVISYFNLKKTKKQNSTNSHFKSPKEEL